MRGGMSEVRECQRQFTNWRRALDGGYVELSNLKYIEHQILLAPNARARQWDAGVS